MKKTSRRERANPSAQRGRSDQRQNGIGGRWEFITSGSIFALGSSEKARRAAYRTPEGELRFVPL